MKGYKVIDGVESVELDPFKRGNNNPTGAKKRKSIADEYTKMAGKREGFLANAKRFAQMTLPSLFNDNESGVGMAADNHNQNGWQSLGSQGVNHLSNKLVMAWFPPQRSFFRLQFTDEVKKELLAAGVKDTDLLSSLSGAEERARTYNEQIQGRIAWTSAAKNLIVSGNALLYLPPKDGNVMSISLNRFVVKRSRGGKLLRLIIKEQKALNELSGDIQSTVRSARKNVKPVDNVDIYTRVQWNGNRYEIQEEVECIDIGEKQVVSEEELPYIVMVWDRLDGEDYGRGLIEQTAGDLYVYQFLSKAIAQGCALMADVKFMVRRGSATTPAEHAKARTGDYVWGEKDDITVVQLEKYGDFKTVLEVMQMYERRIGQVFLLASANRRDAERVTAVELRMDAQELEMALGGTYSQIAVSGQLPYAKVLLKRIKFSIPESDVQPTIVTGIDSLGKANELDKLAQFSEMMSIPNSWSPDAQGRIIWPDFMKFIAANLSMETPWVMTEEAYQQKMQQQQQMQQQAEAMKAAAPALAKGAQQ